MTREQDAKIAEWMGLLTRHDWCMLTDRTDYCLKCGRTKAKGAIEIFCEGDDSAAPYSSDLTAMSHAERVVAERGPDVIWAYADTLEYVMSERVVEDGKLNEAFLSLPVNFIYATATAAQRAEALCRVIDGQEE